MTGQGDGDGDGGPENGYQSPHTTSNISTK